MNPETIFESLRNLAPSVSFQVSREVDDYFSWDGCGDDPRNEGFYPYDVTVSASSIFKGETISEDTFLSGSYYSPSEPIGDIHGYLPQMLLEVSDAMRGRDGLALCTFMELDAACVFLRNTLAART